MSTIAEIQSTTQIAEGTEVVTWGRDGQKCANFRSGGARLSFPIWIGKTYRAVRRQSDGALTWRLIATHGPSLSGASVASGVVAHVVDFAKHANLPIKHVRHGDLVASL
jgi:hypothetical protein